LRARPHATNLAPIIGVTPPRTSLQEATRQLARLLRQENDALATLDFAAAGALLAAKHAAAETLAAAWRCTNNVESAMEDLRKLGALAEENRRIINRAMRVQRRVLDLVARAAREKP
jgi:hypothetical protein